MMRFIQCCVAILVCECQCGITDDWYRWRGPKLNGTSSETDWNPQALLPDPRISWTVEVGIGFSSVVVQGNVAFTMGHVDIHDIVYCLNVADGTTKWKYAYSAALDDRDFEGGTTSTPTIDDERLYVLSRTGELFCLNVNNGNVIWHVQAADVAEVRVPGWGFAAAPLVVDDKLLVSIGESGAAFNKHDGSLIWKSADKESGYGSPVLLPDSESKLAVFASGRSYIGVDIESGRPLWTERWLTTFGCNAADAVVDDCKMFLSSGYNRGAALFAFVNSRPEIIWKTKEMQNQLHGSILFEGYLYGIDGDMDAGATLKCLDWQTGGVAWAKTGLRPGGLALAGGRLIVLTEHGELIIACASSISYQEIARGKVLNGKCRTVPTLSSGRVYCRSIHGQLACVDLRR